MSWITLQQSIIALGIDEYGSNLDSVFTDLGATQLAQQNSLEEASNNQYYKLELSTSALSGMSQLYLSQI